MNHISYCIRSCTQDAQLASGERIRAAFPYTQDAQLSSDDCIDDCIHYAGAFAPLLSLS